MNISANLDELSVPLQDPEHLSRSIRFKISPLLSDTEFSLPVLLLFHSFIVSLPTNLCQYSSSYLIFIS
jgi:hypothetical protein